ncbi:hypothetical protein CSA37_01935 [Candidatus Fermentibacteria bacterium]|nr:MAG: hypothetical protein CSA37_01935 [Candidatus Fermentibacteria bacterium]
MKYFSALVILFSTSICYGFGYHDSMNNGSPLPACSPSMAALGSCRAIGIPEPVNVFTNPARLVLVPPSVQVSASSVSWAEKVLENDLEKTVRTMMVLGNFSGAAVFSAAGLSFAAGYAKVAEFGYEGTHEVYDNPDLPPVGFEVLNSKGSQWEGMAGVSGRISGSLSAGFSGGFRTAEADYEYLFNSYLITIPDSSAVWSFDESEFAWHAGVALTGDIFNTGVSYSSGTARMDETIAFGASVYAAHINKITVGFEGEIISPADGNHFLGKLSVIMPLTNNLNALTSASFDDQRIANRAGFGFGMGFEGRVNRFLISGGILNRFKARKNTAFPNEGAERIDDSATQISFGVSYRFFE